MQVQVPLSDGKERKRQFYFLLSSFDRKSLFRGMAIFDAMIKVCLTELQYLTQKCLKTCASGPDLLENWVGLPR